MKQRIDKQAIATQLNDVSLPALLRFARRAFGWDMRQALKQAGCDDMPRNGMFLVGAIARTGSKNAEVVRELGLTKQAASQLVDTLVLRGYITRSPDPQDRRRMNILLTERGELAARAAREASDKLEAKIAEMLGDDYMMNTKVTLGVIIDSNEARHVPSRS